MTKPKGVFKKRKFKGNQFNNTVVREVMSEEMVTPLRCTDTKCASVKKLTPLTDEYNKFSTSEKGSTNIIIDLKVLSDMVFKFVKCKHCGNSECVKIQESESGRKGLAIPLDIICENCSAVASCMSSSKPEPKSSFEVNTRFVYALRSIGKGMSAGRTFCAVMNLHPPPRKFEKLTALLEKAVVEVSESSMQQAVKEAVVENEDITDIAVAIDGSWQKRGHTSLNGVITATSIDTGKVVDVDIITKYCQQCKVTKNKEEHKKNCVANYSGASGGMEVVGVKNIFERSVSTRGVRYLYYLGDGDSKAYNSVVNSKPYGDSVQIEKMECVGHVQKRLGTRLRKLTVNMRGQKLEDGKLLTGQGRLTKTEIENLQIYYGLAIRNNKDNLDAMKKAVWAIFFHKSSTDESPCHGLCPTGEMSWCGFNRSKITGEVYSHKHSLSAAIMNVVKPIFRDLAKPDLLKKCLHGQTQNPNECFNSIIWNRLPKTVFVGMHTMKIGVHDAVLTYNCGNIGKCWVLEKLGINPGANMVSGLHQIDKQRMLDAEKCSTILAKKARQTSRRVKLRLEDKLEAKEGTSYGAGEF